MILLCFTHKGSPLEHNPDKRATNRAKQARLHNGASQKPSPKLQARMDAVYSMYAENSISITSACAKVGVRRKAYEQWRHRFPSFAQRMDIITARRKGDLAYPPCPFTPSFRETFLRNDYPDDPVNPSHLLHAMDLINSIGPTEVGLILMPPGHAKSSLAEDLLTTVIADDPESRSVIISKTQGEAVKRLLKVQARMEDIDFYADFITEWGPFKPEGRTGRPWSSKQMTVLRKTPRQRDYSLQALGIGGQIQGQSIDWAILDDIADDQNQTPTQVAAMANYVRQSVNTRFRKTGRGLFIGTRQSESDIYRFLMDEDFFDHVLILPAVFDDGSYLWPERYTAQDYKNMQTKAGPRVWALTYQQQDVVTEGQAFPLDLVESAYDATYRAQEVPENSMVVVGVDPAAQGYTAGVALAVDLKSQRRVILDVWNEKDLVGDGGDRVAGVVQFILGLCSTYRARRLSLEDNSAFVYVSSNPKLRAELTRLGCQIDTLQASKYVFNDDAMSLALSTLFSNETVKIPAYGSSKVVYRGLIRQLIGWRPYDKKIVRDIVRAFYYAEIAAQRLLSGYAAETAAYNDRTRPQYMKGRRLQAVS